MPRFLSFLLAGIFTISALQIDNVSAISPDIDGEWITFSADTVEWDRPRFDERADERVDLAEILISQGVENQAVIDAIRNVPRHLFVDESQRRQAYQNNPLPIGHGQTISQPYIVAYMSEILEIEPGDKVLEIGTGSGYHAAVLSELTPHVFSIEIVDRWLSFHQAGTKSSAITPFEPKPVMDITGGRSTRHSTKLLLQPHRDIFHHL